MIPYGRQDIRQEDLDAVIEVLGSDFLTQGPRVPEFERSVAKNVGAVHGVAVNSATSALHIACLALDLGPADLLWTSPITFVATANCALYCGADVDFVDVDPQTYNMDPKALAVKLEGAKANGRLPKVVIPVALCGQSADMKAIRKLADTYGFAIIEDASHAIGGTYDGKPMGDGRYADITIFSFHPVKIITTAEGGMAVTNNAELARRMGYLRSHGVVRDADLMTKEAEGPWYYQQITLGYNYRMTEMQAALGVTQLTRVDEYVGIRRRLAKRYDRLLADFPITLPFQSPETDSAWHLYVIQVPDAKIRRQVFEAMRAADIGVNVHYIPVHTQPYYTALGFKSGDFPASEDYYSKAISIPLFATMSHAQQNDVVSVLKAVLSEAGL